MASAADFGAGMRAFERQDWATALLEWQPLASAGMAEAQFNLGLMYQQGQGVTRDPLVALDWYRRAAGAGFARAQYRVAEIYESGQAVESDLVQAHLWFNLARAQKFGDAKKRRRAVARQMTPEQIAEAELLAREWRRDQRAKEQGPRH